MAFQQPALSHTSSYSLPACLTVRALLQVYDGPSEHELLNANLTSLVGRRILNSLHARPHEWFRVSGAQVRTRVHLCPICTCMRGGGASGPYSASIFGRMAVRRLGRT